MRSREGINRQTIGPLPGAGLPMQSYDMKRSGPVDFPNFVDGDWVFVSNISFM